MVSGIGALAALAVLCGFNRAQEPTEQAKLDRTSVRGTLVDPDGKRVGRLPLVLLPSPSADTSQREALNARGMTGHTASDGSFTFLDVAPGSYHVAYLDGDRAERISDVRLHPGERADVVLRLHRILVRCVDAAGSAIPIPTARRTGWDTQLGQPLVECAVLAAGRRPGAPLRPLACDGETIQFAVEAGTRYVVSCTRAGEKVAFADERALTIDAFTTECTLVDAACAGGAHLDVVVFDPDGHALAADSHPVDICAPLSGRVLRSRGLADFELPFDAWDFSAGTYLVRARDDEPSPMCGTGWNPRKPRWSPVEQRVQAVAGETTRVELRFVRGARLDLDLHVDPTVLDRKLAEWSRRFPSGAHPISTAWLDRGPRGPAARAWLRLAGGGVSATERIELEFFHPELPAYWYRYGLMPGTHVESATLVPPGRYELTVEQPEFERFTTTVDMRADATTSVRAVLAPRAR